MNIIICFLFVFVSVCNSRYLRENNDINEQNDDLTVETSNGIVRGSIKTTIAQEKPFYAFQSIPYAKPPVGELRFKFPQPPSNWTGILDATKPPKSCLQPGFPEIEMSEDCLFVNVFTPSLNPATPLPVIFWIHGGFFLFGDGRIRDNHPDFLLDEDVIMVSTNYRLGVFGYLSTGDDILPGNYGIKDNIMALEWVQKNIAKFGGDPSRVTLMGQSAGAANVALLVQTGLTKGLFSAAIMESGNSLNLWSRTKNPGIVAKDIAKHFKIDYRGSEYLLKEMQKLNASDLLAGATSVDLMNTILSNPVNGLLFGPTIEPLLQGAEAVTGKSHQNLEEGKFNRVPIMTGYNSGEGMIFLPVFDYLQIYIRLYDFQPSKLVPIDMNANDSLKGTIGKIVKEFYFGNESLTASKEIFTGFITDHEFMRPANEFVRLLSNYTTTYFYRFAYMGQLPSNSANREVPGAAHGEELEYIFYSNDANPATSEDLLTRKRLVKLWTNFAKYHNPTPSIDPVFQNITWDPVRPEQINYLNIDEDLQLLKNPNCKHIRFWNSIYKTYGIPPYDTY